MAEAQTKLTKRAYANKEDAKRGALTKTVRNFKQSVQVCKDALAQRIKDGEKEIAFFEAEHAKAIKGLADFEASVKKAKKE
jgi:hypothetical protein